MKLVTDLAAIARLSELHRKENFDFRAKLKWQVEDEDALDAQVHALYKEVSAKLDCRACGNCCKTYEIILTPPDTRRFSKALGIGVKEFKSQHLKNAEGEDGLCFKTKPCPFLKSNSCTQYGARPKTCSEYPYLDKDNFLGRTWSAIDNCSTCPIVFNVWERLKREFR